MAGVLWHANSGEVTMASGVAKTILQIKAPANQRVLVRSIRLFGKQAAGGTDTPGKIRLTRNNSGFGTATGAATLGKNNPLDTESLQTSAYYNFTVEPTTPTDTGLWWELQPQGGIIEFYPPPLLIPVPGGYALNVEATITGTPILMATISGEE